MRISDWSSDVCSSVLLQAEHLHALLAGFVDQRQVRLVHAVADRLWAVAGVRLQGHLDQPCPHRRHVVASLRVLHRSGARAGFDQTVRIAGKGPCPKNWVPKTGSRKADSLHPETSGKIDQKDRFLIS